MEPIRINLYSDTQSQPTPEMRLTMAHAEMGDEQHRLDPSVNRLCEEVAELLGKEDAVFLPSGTMCNQIALAIHCTAGDEIIADRSAHIINFEAGGPASLARSMVYPLEGHNGIFGPDDVQGAIRSGSLHAPRSRLVVVEQTSNLGGGAVWPLKQLEAVSRVARDHDLSLHMDGARLMNAVVAAGVSAANFSATVDSVWLDLSKGLGCPVGAVLSGSREFIHEAWRWKHRIGGAMRQAGIVAAAGSWALKHHVDRLAEDHENAQLLAKRISALDGVTLVNEKVETNMVFFDVSKTPLSAAEISARLREKGIWIGPFGEQKMRAVTHLDVRREDIIETSDALADILVH
ncbi:MAG: low specificity L-threonine aldolase [Candidatus Thioglobus sp.]|nr:MAG: low specificity L-threonine aldolase [Candidatus Thioglobus sp.]